MENYAPAIVYVVDEDNYIISKFQCDFSYAIQSYMGERDFNGNRYIVKKFGEPTAPYKEKPKKMFTVHQPESLTS